MSLNVLVVDDSSTMRKMIKRTLQVSGLPIGDVYEASNGREGLLTLAKYRIDLALIDINMPEMNGEEMISRMKRNPSFTDLPVVIVSTEGSATRIASLVSYEKVGFVHKPFSPERLSQIVHEVTGGAYGNAGESTLSLDGPDF